MIIFWQKIPLPRTPEQFDTLVDRVCSKYGFIDKRHAAAVISTAIQHLPTHQGWTTMQYLSGWISRNIAYFIAKHKTDTISHETHVDQLEAMVKTDPNNQQAIDGLSKAASDGSSYARAALDRLLPPPADNVAAI